MSIKIFTDLKREQKMKMNRGLSRIAMLSFLVAAGSMSAQAQVNAPAPTPAPTTSVTSTATLKLTGKATPLQTGLKETVDFSGTMTVTTTVFSDPGLPATVLVSIDGRGLKGVGATTGTLYDNECEANLSRLFTGTDVIKTTFAFFEAKAGSYLSARTGLLTINLAYDTKTLTLSSATATVGGPSVLGAAF